MSASWIILELIAQVMKASSFRKTNLDVQNHAVEKEPVTQPLLDLIKQAVQDLHAPLYPSHMQIQIAFMVQIIKLEALQLK